MRALEFITGHVIFKLRYNQIYQLKTTHVVFGRVSFLLIQGRRKQGGRGESPPRSWHIS